MGKEDNPYTGRTKDFLGEELRRRRQAKGLSQRELGNKMFISGGYLGQIEVGTRRLTADIAQRLDEELNTDGFFERLANAMKKSNHTAYFEETAELETLATAICDYACVFVPGLFQTEDYIRALVRSTYPTAPPEKLDNAVKSRVERQSLLKNPERPDMWVILHETVLRTVVGGPAVMGEQLRRIAEIVRAHRSVVQVVPFSAGAHGCMGGLVSLMSFDDAPDVVYTEAALSGQLLDDPALVATHRKAYDHARAVALSPEASLKLIESVAEEFEQCAEKQT
ncbi:helix-turn-helix domain-containing protein [Streptomyces yaizuensis]|uniref:Scr1 family TA system antitoxin-like transcriptional regulator n=1 Tax=Streptomyces yaizuensis TaxID=2989713 RepID=A0ABQ5PA26_9ACTN|nr:helix-turn-helix transcriptional regulator [Streptomyces sp. YSPA8]GLF99448.1 Scr1 family TA system antitoxin-like transcriptional regulator [Streptomyces sp. YSPA8]